MPCRRQQRLRRRLPTSEGIAFIVERPVKRQIIAADFRDRVVRCDSCACRVGNGTHLGIRRVERFIHGFFMSIDRGILYRRLEAFVGGKYGAPDRDLVLALCRKVVFCDPARNCVVKGRRGDWDGLPADKSLFHSRPGCGLPPGNLTSQVFANCGASSASSSTRARSTCSTTPTACSTWAWSSSPTASPRTTAPRAPSASRFAAA